LDDVVLSCEDAACFTGINFPAMGDYLIKDLLRDEDGTHKNLEDTLLPHIVYLSSFEIAK
jgi:hypothetical protein